MYVIRTSCELRRFTLIATLDLLKHFAAKEPTTPLQLKCPYKYIYIRIHIWLLMPRSSLVLYIPVADFLFVNGFTTGATYELPHRKQIHRHSLRS